MVECVVNVSEGRRPDVVATVAAACGPALLDVHTDLDHHRSVFTLAGVAEQVADAALDLARVAIARIDLSVHSGVHPRLGAVDVVPFVPLDGNAGLESKGRAQVSMNLTDLEATGVEAACEVVRRVTAERGATMTGVELVGLLPAAELERCSGEFLAWSGLSADRTIEARLAG